MFSFILTEIIVLLIIIFLLLILSGVWPPDSPWAPWWQMPESVIEKMCAMAGIHAKDVVYDLGCGTGKAIIYASTTYGCTSVGIEIDPVRYLLAKWNVWKAYHSGESRLRDDARIKSRGRFWPSQNDNLKRNRTLRITLLKKNFFNVPLNKATVIFVYLVPNALKRLTPKFLQELKPGTKFLSYVYPMPEKLFAGKLQLVKYDKSNNIFYYQLLSKAK